ncbi:MAG: DUF5989 family protein [Myxococcota bacterium]|jgi:hypothetical protein|nr:DUF5989 family protein [Myxococcota bacterium]
MRKLWLILREIVRLLARNKLYFLAPILILLALLAFLVYSLGPVAVITFLYAGI